jgi:colanic acid/amylovoran biosynthesis glycosyltransferase
MVVRQGQEEWNRELNLKPHRILVWRELLLSESETFVRKPTKFGKFEYVFAGLQKTSNKLDEPADFILKLNNLEKIILILLGINRRLETFIEAENIALIHVHFLKDAITIAAFARQKGIPLVVSVHGYDVLDLPNRKNVKAIIYRVLAKRTLLASQLVLSPSRFLLERVMTLQPKVENLHLHYIGTEVPSAPLPFNERSGILFAGRLVPQKGLDLLLRAIANLPPKLKSGLKVTIAGGGKHQKDYQSLASSLEIEAVFLGFIKQADLRRLMQKCLIFCAPSITNNGLYPAEAFGLVVLEASANGAPILTTRNGGLAEAMKHNFNGIQIEDESVESLESSLIAMLSSTTKLKVFSEAGPRFASSGFQMSKQMLDLEKKFRTLIESANAK